MNSCRSLVVSFEDLWRHGLRDHPECRVTIPLSLMPWPILCNGTRAPMAPYHRTASSHRPPPCMDTHQLTAVTGCSTPIVRALNVGAPRHPGRKATCRHISAKHLVRILLSINRSACRVVSDRQMFWTSPTHQMSPETLSILTTQLQLDRNYRIMQAVWGPFLLFFELGLDVSESTKSES